MSISNRRFIIVGAIVSLFLAAFLSFYASSHPDGLEKVGESIGFIETAKDSAVADSPLADYGVEGVEDARISGALAGIIGLAVTAAVSYGVFALVKRKQH